MRLIKGIVVALLLTGCSRGIEYRNCTRGLEDVDLVIDRNAEKYGPWVETVADRLLVKCVAPEDMGLTSACWRKGLDGCTVQMGGPTGNLGEPSTKAVVVADSNVSVARLLCHEIPAHWRETGMCRTHGPECYGPEVVAFEEECKKGVR